MERAKHKDKTSGKFSIFLGRAIEVRSLKRCVCLLPDSNRDGP